MKEIIFAGFGGQGVLTGGLIIADMAAKKGLSTVWMPAYGPTMRGGKANCVVKFGETAEEKVGSPIMEEADILVAMNVPSLDYLAFCKPGVKVFANAHAVPADYNYPEGTEVTAIDVAELAAQAENIKGQNLVMVGAVVKKCGLFTEAYAEESMCKFFAGKGKGRFNDANVAALRLGFAAVS
ncbi:ferredoxin [Lactonifactor longoviformis]|uniref:2-oxoglutarate ferredoxin oxidoreductase subunit gamma n=1 Tax=Lactonifactor longoviformis DSM 17459 TaxID=1122155 RepID=A0A1M4SWH8_9CLOT|nr:2-oxoacid:acceptor oxidoreductase family protein [Lactonifactor longoviformis]POP32538.1 ferredoxin [Lactonifactor longoviformis]SHE36528.1 2-oxoglutarate ferredoxin oxidoreductase subunit gamma [Lactonifactor longoviformis DSM 17459]